MDVEVDEEGLRQRAEEFLTGQKLYYAAVRAQNEEIDRFRKSRSEHLQAIELLGELPTRVGV